MPAQRNRKNAALAAPQPSRRRASLGFFDGPGSTHLSRTMMLAEFEALLAAAPRTAPLEEYRCLIVDENICGKRTQSNRIKTFRHLEKLYGLDERQVVFRELRRLWHIAPSDRPMLAALCVLSRDPLFRIGADVIAEVPAGAVVPLDTFRLAIAKGAPAYSEKTRLSASQNVASSLAQSGHLAGKLEKRRVRAAVTPAAFSYAMALGYLAGSRGWLLLRTPWARLLDRTEPELLELAGEARRAGWLDVRHTGDALDVRPRGLLSDEEMGASDGWRD